jgi:hypothetical protein
MIRPFVGHGFCLAAGLPPGAGSFVMDDAERKLSGSAEAPPHKAMWYWSRKLTVKLLTYKNP